MLLVMVCFVISVIIFGVDIRTLSEGISTNNKFYDAICLCHT